MQPKMMLRDFPRTAELHQANSASLLPQQCTGTNITSQQQHEPPLHDSLAHSNILKWQEIQEANLSPL